MTKTTIDMINKIKNGIDVRNGVVHKLNGKPKQTYEKYNKGD